MIQTSATRSLKIDKLTSSYGQMLERVKALNFLIFLEF
jgi:hypothetical protein